MKGFAPGVLSPESAVSNAALVGDVCPYSDVQVLVLKLGKGF